MQFSFSLIFFRHLLDVGFENSIKGSDFFESSRSSLAAHKELKSKGLGNKPKKPYTITAEMIELKWKSGELGSETGKTLQDPTLTSLLGSD